METYKLKKEKMGMLGSLRLILFRMGLWLKG